MIWTWFEKRNGAKRKDARRDRRLPRRPGGGRRLLSIEALEERVVLSYTPAQISQAYGFDNIYFPTAGGAVKGDGSGQTIAIVVAYQQPNLVADLHAFSQAYGLPDAQITICNEFGSTSPASLPALATGTWGLEASLDVQWVHALAPAAHILVVEANSSSLVDLYQSVDVARQAGVGSYTNLPFTSVVSMSWGSVDFNGDTLSSIFATPAGKTGVTFVACTNDQGTASQYPATDPYVIGVGGTTLSIDAQGNYAGEVGWSGSNGGLGQNPIPSYQQGIQPFGATNTGVRMAPDVSFDGSPTGSVTVYDSYDYPGSPWIGAYGTSFGTPCWGALIAIADQGLNLAGQGPLAGNQALADLYAIYGNGNYQYAFHDVTSGSNASYTAGAGYDLVTGLGSPHAEVIAALLAGYSMTPTPNGPSGAITSTTPTFQWSTLGSATGYYLSIFDVTTSTWIANNLSVPGASYTPGAALASGDSYQWKVQAYDADGALGPASSLVSFSITSAAINHAPQGADKTITTPEDTPYTFTAADFGFSDPNDTPANALLAVKISTLPLTGSLTNNGVVVTAGQFISVANINAGLLKFTPAANANGASYASLTFQVQDNGGVANGGVDLDPTPNTITINVTAVNDPPQGIDKTITTLEDTAYTFTAADFGFSDPNDTPANALLAVKISTMPLTGSLTNNGVVVTAGQFIAVANINAGLLKFTPAANANGASYASLTFQVQDNGGVANGGVDLDPTANTITINVTAVNDAPQGIDKTITTLEDTAYTFTAADFGFSDPNDTPANALLAVKISTLPLTGSLTNNGVVVTAGQFIAVANINAGLLKFTPAANVNGASYASFTFQVQDNGGVANGGVDLDQAANTITINVTAVNDPPQGVDKTVTTLEDTAYTFTAADFGFSDPSDAPANAFLAVKILTPPPTGTLTNNGVAVTAGQFISVANINAGLLKFAPAAGGSGVNYTSFTFQVQDNGGVANGGVDLDPTPNTITISVTAQATFSLWGPGVTPSTVDSGDASALEVGVKFTASVSGYITGVEFYKSAANTGVHTGSLWSASGQLLATGTFVNETASGWQTLVFATPVAITAGVTYTASYHTNTGHYSVTRNALTAPFTNGPLTVAASGGVYLYGAGGFPTQTASASNYWVDVVMSTVPPVDTTPPTVVAFSPAHSTINVSINATVSITFSEAIDPASITNSSILLMNGNTATPATVTYNTATNTATLTPTSPLANSTTYTIVALSNTVRDLAGNHLAFDYSAIFTTIGTTFSVWAPGVTPSTVDSGDASALEVGVKFTASVSGYITGVEFYKSAANTGVHTGSLWSASGQLLATGTFVNETASGWQTLVIATPVAITAGVTYTASYHSNTGHYSVTRNAFTAPFTSGPLTVAANGGVYLYGAGGFPTQSASASNYWVDVVMSTVPPVDTTPPTVLAFNPPSGTVGVSTSASLTIMFSESLLAATVNTGTVQLLDGAAVVSATVTYNANNNSVTLTPTAVLANSHSYTISVTGGVKDLAGNALVGAATSSFTTIGTTFSLWGPGVTPGTVDSGDASALEVGVKFTASVSGYITGVEFYKSAANTGVHTGSLWSASGQLLATGTFVNETASGWQTLVFATPVAITAGVTYTASYHTNTGHYAITRNAFTAPFTSGPLTVAASGGVYLYGAGGFPTQTASASNYWVDVVMSTVPPVDTTPPTVLAFNPPSGTVGVSTSASLTIAFSESLLAATVNTGTVQLLDGAAVVSATVTYNANNNSVTLTPTAVLANSHSYTISVTGGAGGVKDLAGNALVGAATSAFTTIAANVVTNGIWPPAATPATVDSGDGQSVEVGVQFTSSVNGYITGVRFYKSAANTGVHTGSLWSASGQLLATGTFANETASGWQTLVFATPVAITAGVTYTASYHTSVGHFSVTRGGLSSPLMSGPLTVPAGGGVYLYGAGGFPTQTYAGSNYWVDVLFATSV